MILSGIAALFIAIAVAFNVSMNMSETNQLSDFGLANAEALASENENNSTKKPAETTYTVTIGTRSWSTIITCCIDGDTTCSSDSRCHGSLS